MYSVNKKATVARERTTKIFTALPGKKNTGKKLLQSASTEEFFFLKNISEDSNENLATLPGTTTRTIQNQKKAGESFDIAQTERLRKLIRLFNEGNNIFGNKGEFNKWLQTPSYG